MQIKIKKVRENAKVPQRMHPTDGGWDIYASKIEELDGRVIVYTGFCVEIPKGYKLTIVPRSNITKYPWVMNNTPGLVDSGYRDEVQVRFITTLDDAVRRNDRVQNSTEHIRMTFNPEFPYKENDRIAQCYLEEVIPIEWIETDSLDESDNRNGGYGSTGNN